ncbi:hypothetical protein BpHYR1_036030 [Brachionus plicatilis]|uniref:Uncharacterized protein n=1 Tax=Brachionus plicatilis TaxID=10195 RepID=A0A3M7P775_BRAPC|nr:hypothetical protein BpHYR1_036030 [Brachionus plicatilis]
MENGRSVASVNKEFVSYVVCSSLLSWQIFVCFCGCDTTVTIIFTSDFKSFQITSNFTPSDPPVKFFVVMCTDPKRRVVRISPSCSYDVLIIKLDDYLLFKNVFLKKAYLKKLAIGCYSMASTCATTWRLKSLTVFILLLLLLLLLATLARRTFIVSVFVVPFNIDA